MESIDSYNLECPKCGESPINLSSHNWIWIGYNWLHEHSDPINIVQAVRKSDGSSPQPDSMWLLLHPVGEDFYGRCC
jgi:hypothetical protein